MDRTPRCPRPSSNGASRVKTAIAAPEIDERFGLARQVERSYASNDNKVIAGLVDCLRLAIKRSKALHQYRAPGRELGNAEIGNVVVGLSREALGQRPLIRAQYVDGEGFGVGEDVEIECRLPQAIKNKRRIERNGRERVDGDRARSLLFTMMKTASSRPRLPSRTISPKAVLVSVVEPLQNSEFLI